MTLKQFTFNYFGVNTYVVSDEKTKEAIIFDCAAFNDQENKVLTDYLEENELTPIALVNTHLHVDHIMGARYIYLKYGLKPDASYDDLPNYEGAPQHGLMFGMQLNDELPPLGKSLKEGDKLTCGSVEFDIIHVPGHSPGSLCFYDKVKGFIIVGDVLFNGSIGRTDLLGGNHELLLNGIKKKLLVLPDETVVYSGHGSPTTIGAERRSNPFLQG